MNADQGRPPFAHNGREWFGGSPPHVGWWNASPYLRLDEWRWWDGHRWSMRAFDCETAYIASLSGNVPETNGVRITSTRWTDYWPRDGRVLRVDPRTGETTGRTPDWRAGVGG